MDNTFNFWLGFLVISCLGTLAHFFYDWSNQNRVIGLFAAVNESTWEHIKITLTPTFLWSLYDGALYGQNPNYFLAKLMSLLVLVLVIPTLFYAYQKLTKKSIVFVNIAIFYIAIFLSQLTFYTILTLNPINHISQYFSCLGTFVLFGCYMTLTLAPLKSFLFKDPINGKYGFRAHINLFKKATQKSPSPSKESPAKTTKKDR